MITHTFTSGRWKAQVKHDFTVDLYCQDVLVDWPGPWGDIEGAIHWASTIVLAKDEEDQA